MKIKSLLVSMLACTALTACQSEDGPKGPSVDKDEAQISIQIMAAGSEFSRGGVGNPEFEDGSDGENGVASIRFYFYNNDETFNQSVDVGLLNFSQEGNDANIEEIGEAKVVLKDLKSKGTPSYVVAVLNASGSNYNGKSLTELKSELVEDYKSGNNFIMTNSTYNDNSLKQNFATPLKNENFEDMDNGTIPDNNGNDKIEHPVTIYVERLACKVKVDFKTGLLGSDNTVSLGQFKYHTLSSNTPQSEFKTINIKINNWGLNATNKQSNLMKDVGSDFSALTGVGADGSTPLSNFVWDASSNYRSYWCHSHNYGKDDLKYPKSFAATMGNNTNINQSPIHSTNSEVNKANYPLEYVSLGSLNTDIASATYCLENTNTKDVLEDRTSKDINFRAAVTHVLLSAQIVETTGATPNYILYNGELWSEEAFLYEIAQDTELQNAHKSDGANGYTKLSSTDLKVQDVYDGNVNVVLKNPSEAWTDQSGNQLTTLPADRLVTLGTKAKCYTEGKMYYDIPIEHLMGGKVRNVTTGNGVNVNEADYGVVRNHYYQITVNQIKNLGTAVTNPDEPIVPNANDPMYFVGASIKILSWHIVNQNVDL